MIKSAIYLIIFYVFAAVCDFSIAKQFVSQHQLNINPESVIEGDVMLSNSVFFVEIRYALTFLMYDQNT